MPAHLPDPSRWSACALLLAILAAAGSLPAQDDPQDPPKPPPSGTDAEPKGRARRAQGGADKPTQTSQVDPVVVTARKWEELSLDVPQSVTTVGRRQIRDAGLDSVADAARYVPSMLMTEFSSRRLSFPFVRGVGAGQGDPAVTTFIDGVPQLTVSSTNLPLLGVERVEFLRGPSSALYGRNTIGGAIHVISERPGPETKVDAAVTLGNFHRQDYQLSLSTPIVADELFFSVSAMHSQREGYSVNDFTNNDVDSRDSWFGRAQLLWTPNADNEVRFSVYGETALDGGFVLSDLSGLRARPNRINQDFEGGIDRDIIANTLTWNHYGDHADFTSITAVQDWSIDESSDFDFSPIDGIRRFTTEEQTYIHQELRLSSPEDTDIELGEDADLRWLVGVSGFYSDSDRGATNEFRPGGSGILFPPGMEGFDRATGTFEDHRFGAFGQATLTLHDRWELTGALRWDYESKEADIRRVFIAGGFEVPVSATRQRERYDEILPRASLSYEVCESVKPYVLVARGFKAGGFNLTAPAGQTAFGTETNWTYEAGVKTTWLDDRLQVSASVFHIDWDDMQLSQFDQNTGGYVTNAGESQSEGVELEVMARPTEPLQLFGGLGFLDTEFDRFTDQFGQNVSGRDLPFAPEATGHVGAQYDHEVRDDLTAFLRAEYFWVGQFYYDASNLAAERYDLANFRAGIGGVKWRVEGFLKNAFNERYVPVALQINPADPTQFVGESAAPRTYGFTVRCTF